MDAEEKKVIDEEIEEEYGDIKESPPLVSEEITIEDPKDIPVKKVSEYDDIIEQDENLKNLLKFRIIKKKQANHEPVTPEETQFVQDIEALERREFEVAEMQEQQAKIEMERQEKEKEEIRRQYEETKNNSPQKIIKAYEKEINLSGGDSILKVISFVLAMKKAKKKGGKVLVQVFRNRKVLIKWTMSEVTFVEFYSYDEKGNELLEVTRFSEYPYSYEGSPIPVLFAVQGYAEGFDFFSEFRKDLSSEMVSRLVTRAWHSGYLKGAEVATPKEKNAWLKGLTEWMPIILIVGLLILGYMMYQQYNNMAAIYQSMEIIKGQLATIAPTVDVNALVLR